ncbi:MAG TPA: MOSC domain-containing protein [Vicinamibacteria bacterium]
MGRLEAIWIKRFRKGPMDPRKSAALRAGRGIEENANQGGSRQVTVISREAFADVSSELGAEIDPAWRRANFMVSGIDLRESRGRVLDIGGVRVRLTGETRPCEQMDEAFQGLRAALRPEWRGGAFGEVLNDGAVAIGSVVGFIEETE